MIEARGAASPRPIAGIGRVLLWSGGSPLDRPRRRSRRQSCASPDPDRPVAGCAVPDGDRRRRLARASRRDRHAASAPPLRRLRSAHGDALGRAGDRARKGPARALRGCRHPRSRRRRRCRSSRGAVARVAVLADRARRGRGRSARRLGNLLAVRAARFAAVAERCGRRREPLVQPLLHLFVAQTGVCLSRAYLLWARVETAVGAAMNGQSWTAAAQAAGFADPAHLGRTYRRLFAFAPATLIQEHAAVTPR